MVLGRLRDTSSGRQPSVGPGGAGQNRTATPPLPSPQFSALMLWKCPPPGGGVPRGTRREIHERQGGVPWGTPL